MRQLSKGAENYKGRKLYYRGSVISIFTQNGETQMQIQVDRGPNSVPALQDIIFVETLVDCSSVEVGDGVAVWGRVAKTVTITNTFGGQVDQPLLIGDYVEETGP